MQKSKFPGFEEELLRLLSNQVSFSPVTVIVSMAIIAFMALQQAPDLLWLWGIWLGAVVLMQVARAVIIRSLPQKTHLEPGAMLRTAALVNVLNTILHSVSLIFFPLFTPFQAAVQSMLFIGMGVASIITAMGFRPFALAHLLLGLVPLFTMWCWSGLAGPGGSLAYLVALVGFSYTITLYAISQRIFRMFKESFDNRERLAAALVQAEAAGNAKTRFLAAASHDLRQPIHTLSLFSAALGMRELDPRARHIAENIDTAVKALAYQLDALLDISKLDAGIVKVRKSRFSLSDFLQRMQNEFLNPALDRDIKIKLDCPPDAIVNTDPALLERIVRNLLTNSISHNSDCTVQMAVVHKDQHWELSLADTGVGIPSEEQNKVFEEFYQLENPERDRSKGLGLGLAIVQRLSYLLGLDMKFESEPGWGTRFKLLVLADPEKQSDVSSEPQPYNSLDDLRILVVDDESTVRDGMKVLLEVLGCIVNTAGSTSAAVSAATTDKPDLALVDFRLRDHDCGLNTIDRLRHIYPGLPAIIISGDTAPDRLLEAKAAGVPVLNKPVLVDPLKDAISLACHIRN
ncbi:MAG: hybrid sensor histidine kinase/response regulator [Halieaceae bacterium]